MSDKGWEYQIDLLSGEVKRVRVNLTNQISLFDDLLKTKDVNTIKKELEKLETIFTKLTSTASRLHELLHTDEASRVSDMLVEMEENVSKIKKAVSEWLVTQAEIDTKSCRSDSVRKSVHSSGSMRSSVGTRASVHSSKLKTEGDEKMEQMHNDKGKSNMSRIIELMRVQSKLEDQMSLFDDLLKSNNGDMIRRELVDL